MKLLWKAKMSTIQDGGEEIEEGAIYNVTLKKVQIQQAANKGARWLEAEGDQLPPEHTVSQNETCKIRTIKAGTLEKLVENLLTAFGDNDFTYISIFLSTYRSFASTKTVLELLLDRYGNLETLTHEDGSQDSSESKAVVKNAIASISRAWLDQCSEDFRELPDFPCLMKLLDYLKTNMPDSDSEKRAQNLLEQFQNEEVVNENMFNNISPYNLSDEEIVVITTEEFSFFQEDLVAEQLTYMDAELFKKVVPYHCLGSIWSRRDKKENEHLVPTIRATISQFNAVTKTVVSTILMNKDLKTQQRAKIIEKWIHIAHECRILKNFSSLRAIISALQSNSIYRLKKTWACVSKDVMLMFEELSDIFSDHDNHLTSRELLMKEGTSKFANLDSSVKENQKRTQRRLQVQKDMGVMQGTVPYLGTFLTDLVMLDTALQDYVEGGLINFEKRRKEFEVIAQIKLLQSACNSYCITPDENFIQWFRKQKHLTEEESYIISHEVEVTDANATSPRSRKSMMKRISLLFHGAEAVSQSSPKEPAKSTPGGSSGESTDSGSIPSCPVTAQSTPTKEEPKPTPTGGSGEGVDLAGAPSCEAATQSPPIEEQPQSAPGGSSDEEEDPARVPSCAGTTQSPPVKEQPPSALSGSSGEGTDSASASLCAGVIQSPPVEEPPKTAPQGSSDEGMDSASEDTCTSPAGSPDKSQKELCESSSSSCTISTDMSSSMPSVVSTPPILNQSSSDTSSADKKHNTSKAKAPYDPQSPETCVIQVCVENNNGNMYKSVLITNQERTPAVIQKIMLEHNIDSASPDDYELVQIISEEKDLLLPMDANVFYGMNSRVKSNFVLRERGSTYRRIPVKPRSRRIPLFPRTAKRGRWSNRLSKIAL